MPNTKKPVQIAQCAVLFMPSLRRTACSPTAGRRLCLGCFVGFMIHRMNAPIQALPLAPVNASLLYAVLFDLCMFVVAFLLWRKKWFFKV
jgi:hypothetical protein